MPTFRMRRDCSDDELIAAAREIWQSDDLEIDDFDVKVSRADEGGWVQAWVWVPFDWDVEDDDD